MTGDLDPAGCTGYPAARGRLAVQHDPADAAASTAPLPGAVCRWLVRAALPLTGAAP